MAHSTIKGYLSAVRSMQIGYGHPSPFDTPMPKLDQIMRGIKITRAKQGKTPKRKLPVTPVILRQVKAVWKDRASNYNQSLMWAAVTTCFFGFLRSGEITVKANETYDKATHLAFEDVASDSRSAPTFVQLTLKASKTDPFRQGTKVVLGATRDDLCPVSALFSYLRLRGGADGPLFITQQKMPLSRTVFVTQFREALLAAGYQPSEVSQYAGHSFRAGAASTAAALGMEDSLIKTLGRWESSAYLLYLRLPHENLQRISGILSRYKSQ